MIERVGPRPVALHKAANLPAEQHGEADKEQCAYEFAGPDFL